MRYFAFNIGRPYTDKWWRQLVKKHWISTGFQGVSGDRGEVLLRQLDEGDRIFAYANGFGYVGAGTVGPDSTYRLLPEAALPNRWESDHRHVRVVEWNFVIDKLEDAVPAEKVNRHAPRQTKEELPADVGNALLRAVRRQARRPLSPEEAWPFPVEVEPDEIDCSEGSDHYQRAAVEQELLDDPEFCEASSTERQALVLARLGQGRYRKALLDLWGGCCAVTGCSIPQVLVASHAKPWAESNNKERLDKFNGLLLAASVDRLFDQGLIAFDDDGRLLTKQGVPRHDLLSVGLTAESRLTSVRKEHLPYLAAHRLKFGFH